MKKLLLSICTVVFVVVTIEMLSRVYEWTRPSSESLRQKHARSYNYPPHEFHPYTLVYNKPNVRSPSLNTNSLGFRGTRELPHYKDEKTRRVFFLGGSTAVGFNASSDNATIPSQLEQLLNGANLSNRYEVYNVACSAFNSTQELIFLALHVVDYQPDLIILLDGRNDLYFSTLPQWKPHYTTDADPLTVVFSEEHETDNDAVPFFRDLTGFSLRHSAALRACRDFSRHVGSLVRRYGPSKENSENIQKPQGVFHSEAVTYYLRNIQKMAFLCHAQRTPLLVVLQPSLLVSGKPLAVNEKKAVAAIQQNIQYPTGFPELFHQLYQMARKDFIKVEVPPSTHLLDGSDMFAKDPGEMFSDEVHFTDEGNRVAAEFIFNGMRQENLLPQ